MKPKVNTAMKALLSLLLLSAITTAESPYTGPLSRSISTQIASPIKDLVPKCDNYDTINMWFSKQLRLSNILEENILHLETPNESCNFYENDAMQSVFENVEKINRLNQNQSDVFPKISGNLAMDLKQILPWFKKLMHKGLMQQKCCEELEKYLNEVEDHLQDKWEDIKREISKDIDKDNVKIREKLQENQDNLGKQLEDLHLQLENIQEESVSTSKRRRCSKFNRKINNLLNELNNINTEANDYNKEFGEKLKKIKDKLESQDKKDTEMSETLGKREKHLKEMSDKFEKETKGSGCAENDLEEIISKMENRVKEYENAVDSSASYLNGAHCQENGEKLAKIISDLEKLIKDKNKQGNEGTGNGVSHKEGLEREDAISPETNEGRNKKLLDEAEKLRESLKNSNLCCEKTDNLQALGDMLLKSTDLMNQTYDELMKNSDLDLNEIKNLLKKATDKLVCITNNSESPKNNSQNEAEEEDFQKQLTNIQSELDKAKDDFKNLENKLNELPNAENKSIFSDNHKLNENLKKELKKFNENWLKADKRLRLLEQSAASTNLDRLLEFVQQNIKKSESEIERLENLVQSQQANMGKLTNLENQVSSCRNSCRDLDLINDLLDNIEDMERFFKTKLQIATKPTKNVLNIDEPEDALVGGIDFVDQVTDPEVFPQG